MDAELIALASVAASAMVKALTTATWEKVVGGIGALWRRVHPQRAESVQAELAETRQEALAAQQANDENAERVLIDEWGSRLRRLLAADPQVAAELRALLKDIAEPAAGNMDATVTMHAVATGKARVYQAGRDQHINDA